MTESPARVLSCGLLAGHLDGVSIQRREGLLASTGSGDSGHRMSAIPTPPGGHEPVLLEETLDLLEISPGETVVDATVGLGGHAQRFAERLGRNGRLVCIDRDAESLARARESEFCCEVLWVHGNFGNLRSILDDLALSKVDAILADLGVSSPQLDVAERGFSFRQDGPLDMRMDNTTGPTAADLLARFSERELAWIFWEYGEEWFRGRIAKRIAEARRFDAIRTTSQLADLVRSVVPRVKSDRRRLGGTIDPATRVFQALRIAVNDEMGSLESFLRDAPGCVRPGGRAAVISFHSLEDRRVKHAFRNRDDWKPLTKSPVVAGEDELRRNPRSRSAKLRAAERLAGPGKSDTSPPGAADKERRR